MKKVILFLLILLTISCKKGERDRNNDKKNECISKTIDSVFLKKFTVFTDSCKINNSFPEVKYYNKDNRLLMSGYYNRIAKQGNWLFMINRKILLKVFL